MRPSFLLIVLSLACSIVLFSSGGTGAAAGQPEQTATFGDQDLMKYTRPPEDTAGAGKGDDWQGKEEQGRKGRVEKEQDHWCKKGTQSRRKIEKARDGVRDAEVELSDQKDGGAKKQKAATKKLEKARKRLVDAERDLSEIEEEAHRKGVPPGWLRCQFTR